MFKLQFKNLGIHNGRVVFGETRDEVKSKTFTFLEQFHPNYIGQQTIQRLAEIDTAIEDAIEEA
jgi:hypothetical protein